MGFKFSPEFIKFLITKSDMQNHTKISVDQFIVLCVQIQRFTGKFGSSSLRSGHGSYYMYLKGKVVVSNFIYGQYLFSGKSYNIP